MKEWKGNSASARKRLGIKADHTTKGREQDDFYATDPEALQMLLDGCSEYLRKELNNCTGIWECACGNGNLAECLRNNGYNVAASDLKDRGYGLIGKDFLKTKASGFTIILTNPPYSIANEFALHALKILPYDGLYIALQNITYLAGKKRYNEIYSGGVLREVYIFSKRVNCWRNNEKQSKNSYMMIDYAWYVFQKGYKGQPTIYWL